MTLGLLVFYNVEVQEAYGTVVNDCGFSASLATTPRGPPLADRAAPAIAMCGCAMIVIAAIGLYSVRRQNKFCLCCFWTAALSTLTVLGMSAIVAIQITTPSLSATLRDGCVLRVRAREYEWACFASVTVAPLIAVVCGRRPQDLTDTGVGEGDCQQFFEHDETRVSAR